MTDLFGFFKEDNGNLSNTRLNATAMVFTACYIVVYAAMNKGIDGNVIGAASLLCGLGLGAKVVQKGKEEDCESCQPPKS